jgi:hypothetical protein
VAASRAVLHGRRGPGLSRIVKGAALAAFTALLSSCGSTATSVTSPSTINRCALTIQASTTQLPAQGGSGSITVTAARDCAWSASSESQWLSIKSTPSGQGEGAVEFTAARNPDPATRRGLILLNAERAEVTQEAASCEISLVESAASFGQSGGNGTIQVRASSAMCAWTAGASADWIALRTPSGTGSAQVLFTVAPTTGPPRTGTITIAGQKFSVTQAEGCEYSISPNSHSASASGGSGTISVGTTAGCPWTADSNIDWLTVSQGEGVGPGSLTFSVEATPGPARTGTMVVAGRTFTVTQAPGCTFSVQPTAQTVPATGGSVPIGVTAGAGCGWTAASDVAWITVQGASTGSGAGTVTLAVAATTGAARSGTATVAGQRITITQSQGCSYAIAPETASVASAGGTGKVTVTTAAGCAWTAASEASWITVASGANGNGNGEVNYSAAATTGPGRSGTMRIAGRTFTLNQGQGCTFAVSPTSATIANSGGDGTFTIQTTAGCGWTVTPGAAWITIASATSGSGEAQVRFTATANPGTSRTGTITAGGQTFTVQQGSGCSYSLSTSSQNVPANGGTGTVDVTAAGGCGWTATSNVAWIGITAGSSGTGNGTVGYSVQANTGDPRSGTLTVAGQTFTVSQGSGCSYAIAPNAQTIPAGGATVDVALTTGSACQWTTTSNASWLSVVTPPSGSGSTTVRISAQPNAGPVRNGTVAIGSESFAVTQETGCSYTVTPDNVSKSAAGGSSGLDVVTAPACTWTAASAVGWVTVTSGSSGTGNGAVVLNIGVNVGPARNTTLTVAGRSVSVAQESGCTYALSASSQPMGNAGGNGFVNVSAGAGCSWTAASNAAWVTITSATSGAGDGVVQFTVQANTTGAPRSGTLTIAGLAFTINQE